MSKWRAQYKVHPAADVFPMMSDDELAALGEDIKANGLRSPITVIDAPDGVRYLLDGRNRLEAMERAGLSTKCLAWNPDEPEWEHAAAFVISANIRRRHLTKQQQADLIVDAVKAGEKLDQVEPVSDQWAEVSTACGMPTGMKINVSAIERGGRGKVNPTKAKAVAEAKKYGISEPTVKRALAKAEGKKPKPKPFDGMKVTLPVGITAARAHYVLEFIELHPSERVKEWEKLRAAIEKAAGGGA